MRQAQQKGLQTRLSPLFRTPDEIVARSPILLDMTEDAQILFDRGDFLREQLRALSLRLAELGARRVWRGNAWWWDLKPDIKPGEVVVL
jgi:hypothetical protein